MTDLIQLELERAAVDLGARLALYDAAWEAWKTTAPEEYALFGEEGKHKGPQYRRRIEPIIELLQGAKRALEAAAKAYYATIVVAAQNEKRASLSSSLADLGDLDELEDPQ